MNCVIPKILKVIDSSYIVMTYLNKKSLVSIILFMLCFLPSISHADITTGLVGYWTFDEGSGTTAVDSSGNGNNGTLINGPTWANGKIGGAIQFDGVDDKIDVKNITAWDMANTSHSFTLWFKAPVDNLGSGSDFLIERFTGGTPGAGYLVSLGNTNGSSQFSERSSEDANQLSLIDSSNNYKNDVWHHIAAVVDVSSKNGLLYVDGVNVSNDSYVGDLINRSSALTFGNGSSNDNYAYTGLLDDIRIYNRVLSASEIAEIYNYSNIAQDTTPPFRSGGSPTQELSKGISSVNITLNSNENSTCKYSTSAGVDYNSMPNTFSSTGGMSHTTVVSGLSDGGIYNYYIKCQDESGNYNIDDYEINFSVGTNIHYIATSGSDANNGTINYPWLTFSYAMTKLKPGDTLVIKDGTYYQTLNVNVSGTQGSPILIKAQNDGKAIIDGQKTRPSCDIAGSDSNRLHDIVLEGIVCTNSSMSVVSVHKADRVTLKRISASNAGTGNYLVFSISYTTDVLLEDVAAYGTGRVSFNEYETVRSTLRRCFGKWGGHSGGGGPNEIIQLYGADDTIVENCVGTMGNFTDTVEGMSVWANLPNYGADRNKLYGNIVYGLTSHAYTVSSAQHLVKNNELNNNLSIGSYGNSNYVGSGVYQRADNNMLLTNHTCVNSTTCYSFQSTYRNDCSTYYDQGWGIKGTVKNSNFLNGNAGMLNDTSSCGFISFSNSYNNLYGSNFPYILSASVGTGETSINPNYDTATYGNGAYLKRPANLKGLGENGSDIGAEILYRYQDGMLTNNPLWPWPMEDRICKETGHSVTYQNNNNCSGGLWKTLNGVYSTTNSSSSSSSSSSSAPTSSSSSSSKPASSSSSSSATPSSSSSSQSSSSSSSKFQAGDKVVTTSNLNVRSTASLTGTLLGTQDIGALGVVISGPVLSGGYSWYYINYDTASDGWSADSYLEKIISSSSSSSSLSSTISSSSSQSSSSSKRTGKPSKVRDLRARKGSVILEWDPVDPNESVKSIFIYRNLYGYLQNPDISYLRAVISDMSQVSYKDIDVIDNTTYYYSVFALDDKSNLSDPATISFAYQVASSGSVGGNTNRPISSSSSSQSSSSAFSFSSQSSSSISVQQPTFPTLQTTTYSPSPKIVVGPFSIGMRSDEVKILQEMLASDPSIYPEGEVSGYYGPSTTRAVKLFQARHNIEQSGLAGPKTRSKLNEVYGGIQSVQQYQTQTTASSYVFARELNLGSKGDDVSELQKRLTAEGVYFGPITGYFGPMTREGVEKYQTKNNITSIGRVGPQTLKLLNGSTSQSSTQDLNLSQLVEFLISFGIIAPDKVDLARAALKTMEGR